NTRLFSGSNRMPRLRRSFSSLARRTRLSSSWGVQSSNERKCLALISTTFIAAVRRPEGFERKKGLRQGVAWEATKRGKARSYPESLGGRKSAGLAGTSALPDRSGN